MHTDDLLILSDLNLAEAQREQTRFLAPYFLAERNGVLLCASGTRFPAAPFNALMFLDAGPADAAAALAEAEEFFDERERGFGIYVRTHRDGELQTLCEERQLPKLGNSPGMALLEPVSKPQLSSNVTLRVISHAEEAAAFATVSAAAYESMGLPAAIAEKFLADPTRWLMPHWHVQVLYEGEQPRAGAMLLFSHGIAGIYWVGTVPEARGRGYAEAVMRAVCDYAFERGAAAIVLQATHFGEPVYARIGFREFTHYPWYLRIRG